MTAGQAIKAIPITTHSTQAGAIGQEMQILERVERLSHPSLLSTRAYWGEDGRLLVVTEFAERSLRDRLQECAQAGLPGIPPEELVGYCAAAAEGLDYLHAQGLLHGDVKPENLRLIKGHVKVAGLEVSCHTGGQFGSSTGTPAYLAPESWRGTKAASSDQYSLAITYAELRISRWPYAKAGNMAGVMFAHLQEAPDLEPLPRAEQEVLLRALAKEPERRFGSCVEFVQALQGVLTATPPPLAEPRENQLPAGEFRLVHRIGLGAFGEVWQAEGPGGEVVAVRVLPPPADGQAVTATAAVSLPEAGYPPAPTPQPSAPVGARGTAPRKSEGGASWRGTSAKPSGASWGSQPIAPKSKRRAAPTVERQATVRYYGRMNPQKTFPLLVVLSAKQLREVVQKAVEQRQSGPFQVEAGSFVEVEPILPGCLCYPAKEQVRVQDAAATARFFVIPLVLGQVMEPRVVVRQDGEVLAEVRLEMKVVKQTVTWLMGLSTFVLPSMSAALKHYKLDFKSQVEAGFESYASFAQTALDAVSPLTLGLVLLVLTGLAYLWFRPRKRDAFWDLTPARAWKS